MLVNEGNALRQISVEENRTLNFPNNLLESYPALEDKSKMDELAKAIYQESQELANDTKIFSEEKIQITADSKYCTLVNSLARDKLKLIIPSSIINLQSRIAPIGDFIEHCFVLIDRKILADFQYRQFVPENNSSELPEYLISSFNNKEDLQKVLSEYSIAQEQHQYWIDAI